MSHPIKVGVICGGPSPERGISLNSARSILDHLSSRDVTIVPFYIDVYKNFYKLSPHQLYSNTPQDFDFKLAQTAHPLDQNEFITALSDVDIVFPAMHGAFGEDGGIQDLLEQANIPFLGGSAQTCRTMFYKDRAARLIAANGFKTIPSIQVQKNEPGAGEKIKLFFEEHKLSEAVVKPIAGGSSIGVSFVKTPDEAIEKATGIFDRKICDDVLIETVCKGREFTIIIVQNQKGDPIALVPTQIKISYEDGQFFDYRRKYLPTSNTTWACPPDFGDDLIRTIQKKAEDLFTLFSMRDFARIDGWILDNGEIYFSDFNPISGMEQNSFIFQQFSRMGLTHKEAFEYIVFGGLERRGISYTRTNDVTPIQKKPVHVLFGGDTSERHVSVMSGTNVWLKLRQSETYNPTPFLLDLKGHIYQVPYSFALSHTAEEIMESCLLAPIIHQRCIPFMRTIRTRMSLPPIKNETEHLIPKKYTMPEFLSMTRDKNAFLFIGLHGGFGENGTLQRMLDEYKIPYNGSGADASELCMDKNMTGAMINKLGSSSLISLSKTILSARDFSAFSNEETENFWNGLSSRTGTTDFIIKPKADGCSTGIIHLSSAHDFITYKNILSDGKTHIPSGTFQGQMGPVEMSITYQGDYMLEPFIHTDPVHVQGNDLVHQKNQGWIELTIGVLEQGGVYHALSPSLTVAEGHILSLEEKFQGGTGINITPPPQDITPPSGIQAMKKAAEQAAQALGIQNYARLDIFYNTSTTQTILIEANSLPALTPSTVIYHQALAEDPPLTPTAFLETLINLRMGITKIHLSEDGIKEKQA